MIYTEQESIRVKSGVILGILRGRSCALWSLDMDNEIAKTVPGTGIKTLLEKITIMWKFVITRTDYMFKRGMAVWVTGSPCIVIARLSRNKPIFAHYLLRLFLMNGVSYCCRQKSNNLGLIEAVRGERVWRRLKTRKWHIQVYNTYNYMYFV